MAVYMSFVKPSMGSIWGACGKKWEKSWNTIILLPSVQLIKMQMNIYMKNKFI